MHCRSCNTRIETTDRTCPNCGITVTRVASLRPKKARRQRPQLSPSTAVDSVEEVELDQVTGVENEVSVTATRGRPVATAAPRRRAGGGFRPESGDVRRLLCERPELLEPGLRVYTDGKGAKAGPGYSTDVGEIDLLAIDDSGALVVVMVAEPGDEKDLVSDMLQRVGWVRKHLGTRSQEVRGVVLVEPHVQDLSYAASAVAGTVDFKTYRVALSFEDLEV